MVGPGVLMLVYIVYPVHVSHEAITQNNKPDKAIVKVASLTMTEEIKLTRSGQTLVISMWQIGNCRVEQHTHTRE